MSNIWHDINPRIISPVKFMTAYFTHQLTILQTTDLFRERMRRIMTRLTFLYFVRNQ